MPGSARALELRIWLCRRLMLAVCALWALGGAFVARAGDNTWTSVGPDGGYISRLVFHNTSQNTLYARASGGFFRSTDGGAHWEQPQAEITALAQDFAVDPTNSNRIYLVIAQRPSRVLVSTDAGATFSTRFIFPSTASTPSLIAVSADGTTLYAICATNVFRSTDRGTSWEQRTDLGSDFSFGNRALIDPSDASTLYIVRNDQLLATHDGAGTWANIAPSSGGVLNVAVDPTNSNELWVATRNGLSRSSNRGASWSLAHAGYTTTVALDPRSPSTVYTGEPGGSVLRRNGGTWSDITGDLGSFWPEVIAVSPHDSATVAVANVRGLWVTTNAGGGWARRDSGLVSTSIAGFAVAGNRVYTKGNALTRLDHGADTVTDIDTDALFLLTNHQTSSLVSVAPVIESAGGLIAGVGPYIGRSVDDGVTWSLTGYSGLSNDAVVDLAATTAPPSVYYASSALTLQRSIDQGATWTSIVSGLPAGQSPGLIAIAPSNQSIIYAGPRSPTSPESVGMGVYKSTNGGDSWTPANTGIENRAVGVIAVHPTDPDVVYIGTSFSLMKTSNGGATWTELPWSRRGTFVRAIAIDPRAPDTMYAAGSLVSSEVARSADGGATWTSLAAPVTFFPWQATALAIDTTRQDTLRVGTGSGGIREISIRPDLQPDLAIQLTPLSNDIPLLAPTEYRFTISNLGPGPTGDVATKVQLSANGAELAVIPSAGTCIIAAATIDCVSPPLSANATMDIIVSVTPTQRAPLDIVGSVYTDRVDAQLSNNTVSHLTSAFERSELAVEIDGPANVQAGDSVQYTATITNLGPSPASQVEASFNTPPGITRGTFSVTAGTCLSTGMNSIACELGRLDAGATVTLIVNGTIAQAGAYEVHTAALGGTLNDPAEARLSTTVTASPAPQSPSGSGGNSSGGGGGGGAISPLMLLALLGVAFARFLRTKLHSM